MSAAFEPAVGTPGVSASSYWRPRHWSVSAWHEHAPFAFWLMDALRPERVVELGTHNGFSMFVFADAARRLGSPVTIDAIDTWHGDDQAGFYGPEVEAAVREVVEADYADMVTLHRATFAEAVAAIPDGSVDLLHIDGRHGYTDVQEDFSLYLPKLSSRGVVLFHDIAEHQPGFEVHRLWDEISSSGPSFAFAHGHGLGVLVPGGRVEGELLAFFTAAQADPGLYRDFYAARGAEVARQFVLEVEHFDLIDSLRRRVTELEAIDAARIVVEHRQLELVDRIFGLEARLAETSAFMNPTREQMNALEHENAVVRGELDATYRSVTWRIGRAATAPGRLARKVISRG